MPDVAMPVTTSTQGRKGRMAGCVRDQPGPESEALSLKTIKTTSTRIGIRGLRRVRGTWGSSQTTWCGAPGLTEAQAAYKFHRRRVHAGKHLEQDCDVCRIQGSPGQHGAKCLAGPGVGGSRAQGQCDLTGIMASVENTYTITAFSFYF